MTSSRDKRLEIRETINSTLLQLADACLSESAPVRRLYDAPSPPTLQEALAALTAQREARLHTDALYWELAAQAINAGATITSIVEATGTSATTVSQRAVRRAAAGECA